MKKIFLIALMSLCAFAAQAQSVRLEAKQPAESLRSPAIDQQLADYSVIDLDPDIWFKKANASFGSCKVNFSIPGLREFTADLNPVHLFDPNCIVQIQTENGIERLTGISEIFNYSGTIEGQANSKIALTLADNYLSGFFKLEDGNTWYIEPLRHFDKRASLNRFVLYNNSDVLETDDERGCLAKEVKKVPAPEPESGPQPTCQPVKLECGLASDYQLVQKFGSILNAITHDVTILNLVQTNYDNEFVQPVRLQITSIFVSSCPTCDPWPLTSNYDELYFAFADWVDAGGFGQASIDWAQLRTPREIDGLIAGYTGPGGMCGYARVSLVIDYTNLLCKLQKHAAHELGHSFGTGHTPDGIMKIGGFCTDDWNPVSIADINFAILNKPCLSACVALPPAQPVIFSHIYTPDIVCYTFDNACVASYQISTLDPNLNITTAGNTICLQSTLFNPRTATLYVSVVDYCGNISPGPNELLVPWTVYIDQECPSIDVSYSFCKIGNSRVQTRISAPPSLPNGTWRLFHALNCQGGNGDQNLGAPVPIVWLDQAQTMFEVPFNSGCYILKYVVQGEMPNGCPPLVTPKVINSNYGGNIEISGAFNVSYTCAQPEFMAWFSPQYLPSSGNPVHYWALYEPPNLSVPVASWTNETYVNIMLSAYKDYYMEHWVADRVGNFCIVSDVYGEGVSCYHIGSDPVSEISGSGNGNKPATYPAVSANRIAVQEKPVQKSALFPNPASGSSIVLKAGVIASERYTVTIYNTTGQLIKTYQEVSEPFLVINQDVLQPGALIVQVRFADGRQETLKLIVL